MSLAIIPTHIIYYCCCFNFVCVCVWYWSLNSGLCTCWVGALPLELHSQPLFNFWSSYLSLLCAGIIGVHHHTQLRALPLKKCFPPLLYIHLIFPRELLNQAWLQSLPFPSQHTAHIWLMESSNIGAFISNFAIWSWNSLANPYINPWFIYPWKMYCVHC
jgi:hypothetical protein